MRRAREGYVSARSPMARTRTRPSSPTRRRIRRVVTLFALVLVVEYLVLPQLAGARKELHLLSRVNLGLLLLGVLLESGALVAYAFLTRSVLPRDERPHIGTVLRINLSTL